MELTFTGINSKSLEGYSMALENSCFGEIVNFSGTTNINQLQKPESIVCIMDYTRGYRIGKLKKRV